MFLGVVDGHMGPEAVDPAGVTQGIKIWPGNLGNRRFKIHKGS